MNFHNRTCQFCEGGGLKIVPAETKNKVSNVAEPRHMDFEDESPLNRFLN